MKKIIFIVGLLSLLGCEKGQEVQVYFMNESITTPIAVTRKSFFSYGIACRIILKKNNQKKHLLEELNKISFDKEFAHSDLRYLVVYESDTLGIDTFGNVIKNKTEIAKSETLLNALRTVVKKYDERKVCKGSNHRLPPIPEGGFK